MAYLNGPERRLHPRWRVRDGVECRLQTRSRVRLIDISAVGALLGLDRALPVGTQGRLRSTVGDSPFSPVVEICRPASPGPDSKTVALGAIFVSMDDRSRRSLQAFLAVASS